jgi:hypothetical protein
MMNVATTPAVDIKLLIARYHKENNIFQKDLISIEGLVRTSQYRDLSEEDKMEFLLLVRLISLRYNALKTIKQLIALYSPNHPLTK